MRHIRSRLSPLLWLWLQSPDGRATKRVAVARCIWREELEGYEAEGWAFWKAGERR